MTEPLNHQRRGLHAILRKGSELLYDDHTDDDNDDDDDDDVSPLRPKPPPPSSSLTTTNTTYNNKSSSGTINSDVHSSTTEDGDSLNNSMSLTDLHNTTTHEKKYSRCK